VLGIINDETMIISSPCPLYPLLRQQTGYTPPLQPTSSDPHHSQAMSITLSLLILLLLWTNWPPVYSYSETSCRALKDMGVMKRGRRCELQTNQHRSSFLLPFLSQPTTSGLSPLPSPAWPIMHTYSVFPAATLDYFLDFILSYTHHPQLHCN